MSKNENNADKSIDEPFGGVYCKDVTSILTKNATDHSATIKVTEELERERLKVEHAEIDKKIATIIKRIEKSHRDSQDFDRQLYNATELKNHARIRLERTGEMIKVLEDAAGKVKTQTKKTETREQAITKKVEELKAKKLKGEQLKRKKEDLEEEIRKIYDAPERQLNRNLVEEHVAFKRVLEEKIERLKVKRMRNRKIQDLKEQKLKVVQQIFEAQGRNNKFREEVDKRKGHLKDHEQQMKEKLNKLERGFNNDIKRRNELLEDYKRATEKTVEMQEKVDKIKEIIADKEKELESLRGRNLNKQNAVEEENNEKQKEYESEIEKLKMLEEKLQESLAENEQYVQAISNKSDQILTLNDAKSEAILRLCEQKTKLSVEQRRTADQQAKIDELSEKLESETKQVNETNAKNSRLEAMLEEVKRKLEEIPSELNKKREEIALLQQEKVEGLRKQQNFQKANIEFLQYRLDENLKKTRVVQNEVQEYDDGIKWEEMKYEMRKKTSEKLQERLKKEQGFYEKLATQLKQEEDRKQLQKPTVAAIKELPKKSPLKENNYVEEQETIEEEDKTSQSGRKSPGILKPTSKTPKAQAPVNKRVTFEGISSTDSSSVSEKNHQEAEKNPNLEDTPIEEWLRDWTSTSYTPAGRRGALDF